MCSHSKSEMIASMDVICDRKDLISNLPSEILEKILKSLPLQDAVKASILCKGWRYNWTTIRKLALDKKFLNYITSNGSLKKYGFENIINSILRLHGGSVSYFRLCFPQFFDVDSPDFDQWLLLLSRNGVKYLFLGSNLYSYGELKPQNQDPIKLPSSFFSCQGVKGLWVNNFILEPPPASICFRHLTSIMFYYLQIANSTFEAIVSSALKLKTLSIGFCKGLDHMNVDSPNLREVCWGGNLKTISFSYMPDLAEATLAFMNLDNYTDSKCSSTLSKTVECWPGLKKLTLAVNSFKVFSVGGVPKILPTKFYHLKLLRLLDIKFQVVHHFSCALCLIRSSPNLQTLEIKHASFENWSVEPIAKFMEAQDCETCCLEQLRTVKLEYIKGLSPELLLIKYLLGISPVLETMFIMCHKHVDEDKKVKLATSVEMFHRASPKAEVIHVP